MKKKFIFLAMMLLTLLGGVKTNDLRAQEQYRIKVVSNPNDNNGVGQYLTIFNNSEHTSGTNGGVGVAGYTESNAQIFTYGSDGKLCSADGYYITCQDWNVDAYSTYNGYGTILSGISTNSTFTISCNKGYFKVEYVSAGDANYVFCNASYSVAATWTLEPVIADDGIIPAAPTGLTAMAIDHESISLTWTAAEDALKYNVYQGGVKVGETAETSFTATEGIEPLTNYCFTVESVRGVNTSATHSDEACATTTEAPKTKTVVFELKDSYGDGWNGNYLQVLYNGVEYTTYTFSSGSSLTERLDIPEGTEVTINYVIIIGYTYPSENSYKISYEDGTVIKEGNGSVYSYYNVSQIVVPVTTFTIPVSGPSISINQTELAFGEVKVGGEYWSERTEPSFDVNVTASNTTIASISCDNSFFTFTPALSGAAGQTEFNFTVSYDKDATAGEQTGTLVVTYMNGETEESVTVPMSATAYVPAQGDVIENPFEVAFDENGTYTNAPAFANLKDDYTISGETAYGPEDNNPDAVYKLVLEEKSLLNANVSVGSWTYVYDADFGGEGGPEVGNQIHDGLANTVLEAGTYYVVVATNGTFTFTMTKSSVPAPTISYSYPENDAVNVENPVLAWDMEYATDYQVLLGTTSDALDVVATGTATEGQTAYSYQTENLQDNTKYYWQVVATNEAGTTTGEVRSFVTLLPAPQNVAASNYELKASESTTISWDAVEGALSYKVYNAGELIATLEPTVTEYELTGLGYNMNGHTITVTAVHELGESKPGYATIKVAGTFTLAVSVKDANGNAIEGAEVTIDMTNAYDEFQNQITEAVAVEPTDENGNTTVTLPLLYQNDYIYDQYNSYIYPHYTVKASKYPYTENTKDVYYNYSTSGWYINYIHNNDTYNVELSLTLPTVSGLRFTEEGDEVGPVVMKDSTIDLEWDEVEGATAYKVYTYNHLKEQIGEAETVTETSCEISTAEYNMDGFMYGVSALFNDIETSQALTELIKVTGCGTIIGIVTDGTNPVSNIIVHLEGESSIGNEVVPDYTTNEFGEFEFDLLEGVYTLTISHYDYVEYVMENIEISYQQQNDLGTITLTAKPTANITNVTATAEGDYANVSWTGDYANYNVYRRNIEDPQELVTVVENVETTSYSDASWADLEPGSYQYGVSTFVEPQSQTRDTEVIFEEGFENNGTNLPEGWNSLFYNASYGSYNTTSNYCWKVNSGDIYYSYEPMGEYSACVNNGGNYSSNTYLYLISSTIDLNNKQNPKLSFYYRTPQYSSSYPAPSYVNTLKVKILTSESQCSDPANYGEYKWSSNATHVNELLLSDEIDLSDYVGQVIYIVFESDARYGQCTVLDNIQVSAEGGASETAIVWSNEIEKLGPNTFEGTVSAEWNVAGNWSHSVVPAAGEEVIVAAETVISTEVSLNSLNIIGDGSVTVDANASLTVTGAITQESAYSLILMDGGQIFQNNEGVTALFKMNIDNPTSWSNDNKDGWQFISSPLSNVSVNNIAEGNYDLYRYDGNAELEWLNHKDVNFAHETYQHHIGYLASHETKNTLEFKGTLNKYNQYGSEFYEIITYYENEPLKNTHLIGNPYPFNISWADFAYNKGMVNGYAYVKADGNYEYRTEGTIAVGDGFFVQASSGTGEYDTYYYYVKGSGQTRSQEQNNSLNIVATSNAGKDNVVINLGGEKAGFNKLQNFNDAIATVYVADNGANYGIYNCNEDVQEVELSFNANQMGNYTISIQPDGKFQTVTLVDRFTGVETNMLAEDYHFTAMSGTNNNRFIVRMVNGQQSTDNSHFVYQSGEDLIIEAEGAVQIIDVMGRVVYSNDVESTNGRINVSDFNNGTYVVRVINGSEVKVEKVVIY